MFPQKAAQQSPTVSTKGPHSMSRRTALVLGAALALGAGLAVLPTQAQAATVVVSTTADLTSAIKNATAGTVIQVRAGTYYPTATLQSTANGRRSRDHAARASGLLSSVASERVLVKTWRPVTVPLFTSMTAAMLVPGHEWTKSCQGVRVVGCGRIPGGEGEGQ